MCSGEAVQHYGHAQLYPLFRENFAGENRNSVAIFSSNDGCRAIVCHRWSEFHSSERVFSTVKEEKKCLQK